MAFLYGRRTGRLKNMGNSHYRHKKGQRDLREIPGEDSSASPEGWNPAPPTPGASAGLVRSTKVNTCISTCVPESTMQQHKYRNTEIQLSICTVLFCDEWDGFLLLVIFTVGDRGTLTPSLLFAKGIQSPKLLISATG